MFFELKVCDGRHKVTSESEEDNLYKPCLRTTLPPIESVPVHSRLWWLDGPLNVSVCAVCCPLQSAAGCRGGLHTPHHGGQLHGPPGPRSRAHGGGGLRSHRCHCGRGTTGAHRCGGRHRRRLWRLPAHSRCHRLWISPATAGGPAPPATCHLTELSGMRRCFAKSPSVKTNTSSKMNSLHSN